MKLPPSWISVGIPLALCAALSAQEHVNNLTDAEELELQRDLTWVNILLWGMVAGLLVFAYSIRFIARQTTAPCHWCAEFVSKRETVCPRCGRARPFGHEALRAQSAKLDHSI